MKQPSLLATFSCEHEVEDSRSAISLEPPSSTQIGTLSTSKLMATAGTSSIASEATVAADTPTSGEPGNPSNRDHSQPVLRVILNVLHGAA